MIRDSFPVYAPLASSHKPFGVGLNIAKALSSKKQLLPSPATFPNVVSAIRGGDNAGIDFDRSVVRLDAIGAYPVVAAIMMGAMLNIGMETPKVIEKIPGGADKHTIFKIRVKNTVTCLFSIFIAVSIAAASYSLVIFTLVVIYSKTAIGMELDECYLNFLDATSVLRVRAFRSFICSMIGYIFSLACSMFLKEKGIIRWIMTIPTLFASIIGLIHYKFIMDLASELIYSKASIVP
mmetsp:Transcript_40909/g.85952  ORF Transcript_40909/g.85952 Transcript_40909/m.85952 type:complete len:236 (+) Transcript_40909:123-830(+)